MTPSPSPSRAVARVLTPAAVVGAVVLVFATVMMAGWALRVPGIVGMFPGYVMAFNTALCFFVTGLALLAEFLAPQPRRVAGFLCAGVLLLIAAVVLLEYLLGAGPGIDWPELHRWYATGNPNPGRMALTSSIGFLCIGTSLVLMRLEPGRTLLIALRALTIAAVFIGAVALLGHVLDLDKMFDVYVFKQISLPTGLGFVLVGAALWAVYRKEAWNRSLFFKSDDARLMLASALILVAVATVSLLAGFVIVEQSVDRSLSTNLLLTLKSRASLFASAIERYGESAGAIAARPGVTEAYGRLPRDPRTARSQLALRAAGLIRDEGYSAVAFKDARGAVIVRGGAFIVAAPLRFDLGGPRQSALLWNGGFLLRTESAVRIGAGQPGTVLSERPIPDLQKYLVDVSDLGESGEIELCAAQGEQLGCAPSRFNPKPYLAPRAVQAVRTPMSYAVAGLTGTVSAVGYDGKKIFAAHTPVGAGGLGMVVKVGTVEYFRPVREQVLLLVPAIAALLALGLFLLRSRIHPLARRLVISEGRLTLALEASRLALWDFDVRSGEIYLSDQWRAMLGGEARPTLTTLRELRALVHPEDGGNLDRNLSNVLKGAVREYDIEHRVRKADGQWLWIRSRGEIVDRTPDGRALRMTGTNTDITARKELDAQLVYQATHDALTGFPNRGLYYDRLNQAIARSRRNRSPMAVMYLDVDKFKTVNDELGHDAGDALLKAFAERLASRVRATDTVARLGGDEFGVILETLRGRDDGRLVAEKIVEAMRSPFKIGVRSLSVTTSAGIAFFDGIEKAEAERLVKKADEALYQAKGAGRNNYQVAA